MTLKISNSLTRTKEEFQPIKKGLVRMYVCGPTVYDYIHIGNARTFVSFDVIRRYLEYLGYDVLFVSNITDVGHLTDDADAGEDKILKRAKLMKLEPMVLVEKYIEYYLREIDLLGNKRPDIMPRATGHIIEIIELTKELIKKGFAYEKNGSVYFNVLKFKEYGKLSGNTLEALKAGARVSEKEEKKNPLDFALWKKAEPEHIMKWPSPWGAGFPGWHIECSVMSEKYLGCPFDIHGGGKDLKFPHNENEIAQSEAILGKKFCNFWVHTEYVMINNEKMSKSKGNFITAYDAVNKFGAETVRLWVVSSQYDREINFSEEQMSICKRTLERVYTFYSNVDNAIKTKKDSADKKMDKVLVETKQKFLSAMDDDFNTPLALSVIYDLIRDANEYMQNDKISHSFLQNAKDLIKELGSILGVFQKEEKRTGISAELIEFMIKLREEARKNKDFKRADEIREKLKKSGIIIEDTDKGIIYRFQ